jgi:hypothetical protein
MSSEIGVNLITIGYLAKRIVERPDWLKAPEVHDIYSVSGCTSGAFMDYIEFWRHNGFWLFDSPEIIQALAREHNVNMDGLTYFYYEVYEKEFDEERKEWMPFGPAPFPTNVMPPVKKELHGYDVVTFSQGTTPECSPLSCNHLASEIPTNTHCLLESFEEAKQNLELGKFEHSEPGPFRIFAVYTVDPNHWSDSSSHV